MSRIEHLSDYPRLCERIRALAQAGYSTVQMPLGQRVSVDPMSQPRRTPWTVTNRIRWFWCGHQLCTAPGYDWSGWLAQPWESLRQLMTTAPVPPVSETASPSALEEAA